MHADGSRRAGLVTSLLALVVLGTIGAQPGAAGPPPTPTAPNIVLIVTDDQRKDQLAEMDLVQAEIGEAGAAFRRAFVANPLCCPARASILTGTYSHTNRVWTNGEGPNPSLGGWPTFEALGHESRTIAVALDAAGYRNALIGKYLNGGQTAPAAPGWDRWVAFGQERPGYVNYTLRVDEDGHGPGDVTLEPHGDTPADYSTDVLADHARSFIETTPAEEPLFLYFAPFAPHGLAIPAQRHARSMDDLPVRLGAAFDERNVDDKPAYIRDVQPWSQTRRANAIARFRTAVETLEAVDEAVAGLIDALEDTGRLGNTLLLFTSDNGLLFGEHRWSGKLVPYDESVRVPLLMRWDGVIPPDSVIPGLVSHVDLAPTLADAAGTTMPGEVDGVSLLPMLTDAQAAVHDVALFEHVRFRAGDPPSYCGIHTATDRVYVRYASGEEEFYNLRKDDAQLRNRAGGGSARLADARERADLVCPFGEIPGFRLDPG